MNNYTVIPWPGGVIGKVAETLASSVNADPPYSLHRAQAQALADAGLLLPEGTTAVSISELERLRAHHATFTEYTNESAGAAEHRVLELGVQALYIAIWQFLDSIDETS